MHEKISFRNSRGLNLVGDFYRADSSKGVIMCHGFTGDRHESGKFDMLARKLQGEGYNALLFDFGGSGESDDEPLNTNNQANDFRDAIKYLESRGITRLGAVGMSLGPIAILKNKKLLGNKIKSLVLWCPVTYKKDDYAIYKFSKDQVEELERTGRMNHRKVREGRPRSDFVIDKQVIIERENLDQKEFLRGISLPVLIIHGDADTGVPYSWSKEAMQYLPPGSKLETIAGAGHTFDNEGELVTNLSVEWFTKHL